MFSNNINYMCGITGCVTAVNEAIPAVMRGLNKLQNRGYDSAGVCTLFNGELCIKKYVSDNGGTAMEELNIDEINTISFPMAIGHTRWATHGPKTLENAHPHHDNGNRFAIVHNGIIENYLEMKKNIKPDCQYYGQTDSEVFVKYLSCLPGDDILLRLDKLNKLMVGAWAILIMDKKNSDKIYFMKNGSPLLLGFNKDKSKIMFVSEFSGFDQDIEFYYKLIDGDYGFISHQIIFTNNKYDTFMVPTMTIQTTPAPFKHWTIKEINDQPAALISLISNKIICNRTAEGCHKDIYLPELDQIKESLMDAEHLIFLACGTSYYAAQFGSKFFKEFQTRATIDVIDGADFEENDIPVNRKTVMILLSQSGETKDLYRALVIGKEKGIKTIGIINVENSLIAREVDACIYLKAGREYAVASTKAFTSQAISLLFVALWMNPQLENRIKQKYIDCIEKLPDDFANIIKQCDDTIKETLPFFNNQNHSFVLGKQQCEWIAKEGSLKIKEITYIHAEGYSAAALKHGPFALLNKDMPVILIANNDKFFSKVENITAEIKSRFANIIFITNKEIVSDKIDNLFYFKTDSVLFPLMAVVPLQFLAYHLALERGNHPDYPRNLAKVVTVE